MTRGLPTYFFWISQTINFPQFLQLSIPISLAVNILHNFEVWQMEFYTRNICEIDLNPSWRICQRIKTHQVLPTLLCNGCMAILAKKEEFYELLDWYGVDILRYLNCLNTFDFYEVEYWGWNY